MNKFLGLVAVLLASALAARAGDPMKIPASGGRITLPLSGLSVAFPAHSEITYELKGSWSLKLGYDARDVIDGFKDEKLVSGTWVQTGYFDAGGPKAAVESTELVDSWPTTTMEAWGLTWQVRGGKFKFAGSLGLQPALILAADRGANQPTLLLNHYFIGEENVSGDEMIRRVKETAFLTEIVKAYRQQRWAAVKPLHEAVVNPRDNSVAARVVTLPKHDLTVHLPDDGYFWKTEGKPKDATDFLYRLGPTFPEMTLDVLVVDGATVDDAWKSVGLARPTGITIANLPDGWEVGPEVTPSAGKESTIARQVGGGKVMIVGFISNTVTTDVDPLAPVLEALASAARDKYSAH
jgi:hypothetical protein